VYGTKSGGWAVPLASYGLIVAVLAGCGSNNTDAARKELSHIRLLTSLYAKTANTIGHNPKSEEEFKQAIADSGVKLENLRVASIDELFVSERDGKPLVVVYGQSLPNSDVIVYEQEGVDGLREVGHKIGKVEQVDAAKFAELVPNAK
jgi:hypothetical protein